MDAIFLDIDGVICTPSSYYLNRLLSLPMERQRFDPMALFWLRRLIRATGAMIVLSSSWKDGLTTDDPFTKAIMDNLFVRLSKNGTPITDATPQSVSGDKSEEIAEWLRHNACDRYAILDDRDCFAAFPEVRAHWVPVGAKGLRRREVDSALRLLKGRRGQ